MLVLSRFKGESLLIGSNVEVYVVAVERDRVRLGIRAPRDISIHRKEIADRMEADGIELSQLAPVGPGTTR